MNQSVTEVIVEQPLASPGSANEERIEDIEASESPLQAEEVVTIDQIAELLRLSNDKQLCALSSFLL